MNDLAKEELAFNPETLHISGAVAQRWNTAIEVEQNHSHAKPNQGRSI